MYGDNGVYIGVRHWTHEQALIREFQRTWNARETQRAITQMHINSLRERAQTLEPSCVT